MANVVRLHELKQQADRYFGCLTNRYSHHPVEELVEMSIDRFQYLEHDLIRDYIRHVCSPEKAKEFNRLKESRLQTIS